jgi:hypothetical protein
LNPPILPPIIPFGSLPSPNATCTNPGCADPASQGFPMPPADPARSHPSGSGLAATSNGEMQRGNQDTSPTCNGSVTSTAGTSHVNQISGEGGQRLDLRATAKAESTGTGLPKDAFPASSSLGKYTRPPRAVITNRGLAREVSASSSCQVGLSPTPEAVVTGHGLPAEVFADSVNSAKNLDPTPSVPIPTPVEVHADSGRPGGLPMNVIIR